jgi:hypothetical protein
VGELISKKIIVAFLEQITQTVLRERFVLKQIAQTVCESVLF